MSQILTFLGKGGTGRTTVAIAAAKKLANAGSRVLLVAQDPSPTYSLLLETELTTTPTEISPKLEGVYLKTTSLLEKNWEDVKEMEAKYLRSPTLNNVYGQELGVLPGMDAALALNFLREHDQSQRYDVIVYDGTGDLNTLRMLGIPEVLSWYIRRFRRVLEESEILRAITPFIQPITAAILNFSLDSITEEQKNQANNLLESGKTALADPNRVITYLVSTSDPAALTMAKYLWGSAQQIGLAVGGVILNQAEITEAIATEFDPLSLTAVPQRQGSDWQPLMESLPNFRETVKVPKPLSIEVSEGKVKVFLPGFNKNQVKLTQYGPEITIEAGDQRRNIDVPPSLRGKPVAGAKFQNGYLIISF